MAIKTIPRLKICILLNPTAPVEGAVGGSSKEPRNSNIARGIVKLLYEGDLQFVEFLNSKENKQDRNKSIEHAPDTNKLYRLETCWYRHLSKGTDASSKCIRCENRN